MGSRRKKKPFRPNLWPVPEDAAVVPPLRHPPPAPRRWGGQPTGPDRPLVPPPRQAPLVDNRWSEAGGRAQAPLVDNRWGEAAGQAQAPLVDNRWGGAVGRAQAPLVPDRWGGDPLTAAIIDLVLDLQRERAPGDHEPEVYGLVEFAQLIGCPLPDLHDLSQWNRVYSLVLRALGLALQARNFHRGLFRNYAVTGHGPSARISLYVDTR